MWAFCKFFQNVTMFFPEELSLVVTCMDKWFPWEEYCKGLVYLLSV